MAQKKDGNSQITRWFLSLQNFKCIDRGECTWMCWYTFLGLLLIRRGTVGWVYMVRKTDTFSVASKWEDCGAACTEAKPVYVCLWKQFEFCLWWIKLVFDLKHWPFSHDPHGIHSIFSGIFSLVSLQVLFVLYLLQNINPVESGAMLFAASCCECRVEGGALTSRTNRKWVGLCWVSLILEEEQHSFTGLSL